MLKSVRQRNAANAKKYYDEKIKTDPEKYTINLKSKV
jgi:hypothetical protein